MKRKRELFRARVARLLLLLMVFHLLFLLCVGSLVDDTTAEESTGDMINGSSDLNDEDNELLLDSEEDSNDSSFDSEFEKEEDEEEEEEAEESHSPISLESVRFTEDRKAQRAKGTVLIPGPLSASARVNGARGPNGHPHSADSTSQTNSAAAGLTRSVLTDSHLLVSTADGRLTVLHALTGRERTHFESDQEEDQQRRPLFHSSNPTNRELDGSDDCSSVSDSGRRHCADGLDSSRPLPPQIIPSVDGTLYLLHNPGNPESEELELLSMNVRQLSMYGGYTDGNGTHYSVNREDSVFWIDQSDWSVITDDLMMKSNRKSDQNEKNNGRIDNESSSVLVVTRIDEEITASKADLSREFLWSLNVGHYRFATSRPSYSTIHFPMRGKELERYVLLQSLDSDNMYQIYLYDLVSGSRLWTKKTFSDDENGRSSSSSSKSGGVSMKSLVTDVQFLTHDRFVYHFAVKHFRTEIPTPFPGPGMFLVPTPEYNNNSVVAVPHASNAALLSGIVDGRVSFGEDGDIVLFSQLIGTSEDGSLDEEKKGEKENQRMQREEESLEEEEEGECEVEMMDLSNNEDDFCIEDESDDDDGGINASQNGGDSVTDSSALALLGNDTLIESEMKKNQENDMESIEDSKGRVSKKGRSKTTEIRYVSVIPEQYASFMIRQKLLRTNEYVDSASRMEEAAMSFPLARPPGMMHNDQVRNHNDHLNELNNHPMHHHMTTKELIASGIFGVLLSPEQIDYLRKVSMAFGFGDTTEDDILDHSGSSVDNNDHFLRYDVESGRVVRRRRQILMLAGPPPSASSSDDHQSGAIYDHSSVSDNGLNTPSSSIHGGHLQHPSLAPFAIAGPTAGVSSLRRSDSFYSLVRYTLRDLALLTLLLVVGLTVTCHYRRDWFETFGLRSYGGLLLFAPGKNDADILAEIARNIRLDPSNDTGGGLPSLTNVPTYSSGSSLMTSARIWYDAERDRKIVGKISVFLSERLGRGADGLVFRGEFEDRPVAVKRLQKHRSSAQACREVATLIQVDEHDNVVRYYAQEWDESFIYVALELCKCSLYECVMDYLVSDEKSDIDNNNNTNKDESDDNNNHQRSDVLALTEPFLSLDIPLTTIYHSQQNGIGGRFASLFAMEGRMALQQRHPDQCSCHDCALKKSSKLRKMDSISQKKKMKRRIRMMKNDVDQDDDDDDSTHLNHFSSRADRNRDWRKSTLVKESEKKKKDEDHESQSNQKQLDIDEIFELGHQKFVSEQIRTLCRDMISGVSHLHSLNIVHRDIKPQNILISQKQRAKLADMGLAKEIAPMRGSFDSHQCGTLLWNAPELLFAKSSRGDLDLESLHTLAKQNSSHSSSNITHQTSPSMCIECALSGKSDDNGGGNHAGCSRHTSSDGSGTRNGLSNMSVDSSPVRVKELSESQLSLLSAIDSVPAAMYSASMKKLRNEEDTSVPPLSTNDGSSAVSYSLVRLTRAVDIFSLGCVFSFVLSKGKHPYGQSVFEQQLSMQRSQPNLDHLEDSPEALDLISSMIAINPDLRPTAEDCLRHPFFMSEQDKCEFLLQFSDVIEKSPVLSEIRVTLEMYAHRIIGAYRNWSTMVDFELLVDSKKHRRYNFTLVKDYLRLIRNKWHHFSELPLRLQSKLGGPSKPALFLAYFTIRCPKLLMFCFQIAAVFLSEHPLFQAHFAGLSASVLESYHRRVKLQFKPRMNPSL